LPSHPLSSPAPEWDPGTPGKEEQKWVFKCQTSALYSDAVPDNSVG